MSRLLRIRGWHLAFGRGKFAQPFRFQRRRVNCAVLRLVEEYKPMHLSIVGGDPLVRYRELEVLLPQLVKSMKVQVVTSAFPPDSRGMGDSSEFANISFD